MTSFILRKAAADRTRTDVVVIGVVTEPNGARIAAPGGESIQDVYGRRFDTMLAALDFSGKHGELLRIPSADGIRAAHLILVGLGAADEDGEVGTEQLRRAAGTAARSLRNDASVTFALPARTADEVRAVTDGIVSGLYRYDTHRSSTEPTGIADIIVLTDHPRRADIATAFDEAQQTGALISLARDWVNAPPNHLAPMTFADQVRDAAKGRRGVTVTLHDADALAEMGAGGILAVGQGSTNPPCLVELAWRPKEATGSVALVGKGITFDSGGLSLKPAGSMTTMKCDMAGAATVVATLLAVAALEIPVAVTAFVPMAENMPSGSATRPGDVLTMLSGQTVEVLNTDAEGRLILADALTRAVRSEPDVIVDVATLTGACVVALGEKVAGLFGDDTVVAEIQAAAQQTGEMVWHLPIPDETRASVRTESKIADLAQHNPSRWGGASYAAAFLAAFTAEVPWAHVDVAGPAFNTGGPWGHVPAGGTGFGITSLVEFIRSRG